jgi:hypothetical protein
MWIFIATTALASPSFPLVLADELAMPCTPNCTACHASAAGGSGTANQDFAFVMMAAGLVPADDASVVSALAVVESDGTDSNGDGMGDVQALRLGFNPNPDGIDFCAVETPVYGCFPDGSALLGVGGLLGYAWSLRRRRG